ncbi:type IVB secretion system protein IcmH/DotU [Holophaga foetida]|uniref:type IVB secretion system protein IcmH/DotU n=1 Tax=Holophaga foetida TaxID=35839 RepID=UPI0002472A6E|nr:type IVB secretion system protein IcmH/DotU [Holophaga foetida]
MEATLSPAEINQELMGTSAPEAPPLKDLMEDGIYLLFLLRSGTTPHSAEEFNRRVDAFLAQFERNAANFGKSASAIQSCKYAFCALMDEIVLNSQFEIRDAWERSPLQLRLFGEHLAGDGFFNRLESLRLEPQKNLETLEVFYTCLLLGFQGRYLLEGEDKLGFLIARLGQEISGLRGAKPEFAPHWQPSFQFGDFVRHELPLWIFYTLLVLVAIVLFLTFTFVLRSQLKDLERVQRLTSVTTILQSPSAT